MARAVAPAAAPLMTFARVRLHVLHGDAAAGTGTGHLCRRRAPAHARSGGWRARPARSRRPRAAASRPALMSSTRPGSCGAAGLPAAAWPEPVACAARPGLPGRASALVDFPEPLLALLPPARVGSVNRARLHLRLRGLPSLGRRLVDDRRRGACARDVRTAGVRIRRRHVRARASSSTTRIVAPTFTLSPGLTRSSLITPLTDEGTSMVALSVSSSRTGLVALQRVAGVHEHAHDVAGGDVLAEFGEGEFGHGKFLDACSAPGYRAPGYRGFARLRRSGHGFGSLGWPSPDRSRGP